MRLTIAYSKIKKRNLVLINNDTYQRETLSERPIRQPLIWTLKKFYPWSKVYDMLWSSYTSIMLFASCPCNLVWWQMHSLCECMESSPTHSIKIESSGRVGPSVYESFNFTATMTMTGWILCKGGMGRGSILAPLWNLKNFLIGSSRIHRRLRE